MRHRDRTENASVRSPAPDRPETRDADSPPRLLSVPDLILAQVIVVGGLIAASMLDQPGWYGAAATAVVGALLVTPARGQSALGRARLRLRFLRHRRRRTRGAVPVCATAFDALQSDTTKIGFVWNEATLVSVVRVESDMHALTTMELAAAVSGETAGMGVLADCLRQHDIRLASIDVVSHGARLRAGGQVAATYDAVLGPLPAIAQRSAWVVVRFDPMRCPDAVEHRGGGWEGTFATAATATRRVANRLAASGLRTQILNAAGIDLAMGELTEGIGPNDVEETWTACHWGRVQLRSFSATPAVLTTEGLGALWTVPSYSTTVCVSLRPDDTRDRTVDVRGLATFISDNAFRPQIPGFEPLDGRQFDGWVGSFPAALVQRPGGRWVRMEDSSAVADLRVPVSGCGQIVGADEHGRAVAVSLFGNRVGRVQVSGTLHLVQQVALRSLALGARVRVHSSRPAQWHPMVARVGDTALLHVTDPTIVHDTSGIHQHTVEVFDGVAERPARPGVTTWAVAADPGTPSHDADVSLRLLDRDRSTVEVRTEAGTSVVTMVTTDDEMRYLQSSFDLNI